jgi:hypothetical protein
MKGRGLPVEEFDWPCDRREAHHPHEVIDQTGPQDWDRWECPGVGAHPLTMIGGAYKPSS